MKTTSGCSLICVYCPKIDGRSGDGVHLKTHTNTHKAQ